MSCTSANVLLATTGTAIKQWLSQLVEANRAWSQANERLVALLTQWSNLRLSLRHVDSPVAWGELAQLPGLRDAAHSQTLLSLAMLRTKAEKALTELDTLAAQQRDATLRLQTLRDTLLARDLDNASTAAVAPTRAPFEGYRASAPSACVQRALGWAFELDAALARALVVKRLAVEGITAPLHGALRVRVAQAAQAAAAAAASGTTAVTDGAELALAWLYAETDNSHHDIINTDEFNNDVDRATNADSSNAREVREVSLSTFLALAAATHLDTHVYPHESKYDNAQPSLVLPTASRASQQSSAGASAWALAAAASEGAATGAAAGTAGAEAAATGATAVLTGSAAGAAAATGGLGAATGEVPAEAALRAYLSAVSLEPGRAAERVAHVLAACEHMLKTQLTL